MSVFIDTSAFIAFMDVNDKRHTDAAPAWASLVASSEQLVVSSYLLVETCSLLQARFGGSSVSRFASQAVPLLSVVWVDEPLHQAAMGAFLAAGAGRHAPSLVDCISFEIVKRQGIERVFAYDQHFARLGCSFLGGGP